MDDTLYLFVNKHIYTVDSYWCIVGFLNSSPRHNRVDTNRTLDAAKWNGAGDELSSCVINNIPLDHVIFGTLFGTNLPVDLYPFVLCLYIYI